MPLSRALGRGWGDLQAVPPKGRQPRFVVTASSEDFPSVNKYLDHGLVAASCPPQSRSSSLGVRNLL